MSEYKINPKFVSDTTDDNLAISKMAYEIENANIHELKSDDIIYQIQNLQSNDQFPKHLKYVDSFYDAKSGLSGVAFENTKTKKVTVGFAGTNLEGSKDDTIDDALADINMVVSPYGPQDDYFKKGQKFIKDLKNKGLKNVDTVTGHSKGGRDCMILGMDNQIPHIVTYNSAPLYCTAGENLLHNGVIRPLLSKGMSMIQLLWLIKNGYNHHTIDKMVQQYQGDVVNYVSTNDVLNRIARPFQSYYPGETKIIDTGDHQPSVKGHDLGQFISGAGNLNYRLSTIDIQKEGLLSMGSGGLTSAQKIYLDANVALSLVVSFKDSIRNQQQELENLYRQWEQHLTENWNNTKKAAADIGEHLSSAEELSALHSANCSENSMVNQPKSQFNKNRNQLKQVIQQCDQCMSQYRTTIQNQVKTDTELSSLFK